jgi:hypothetical protein
VAVLVLLAILVLRVERQPQHILAAVVVVAQSHQTLALAVVVGEHLAAAVAVV